MADYDADHQEAYQRYRAVKFFGSLDGLRCICIAMVLWHHGPARFLIEDTGRLWGRGFTGVDFFFVLSGFLITTLLLREEQATGRISLRQFYRRRILRIVPIYFFVVTAVGCYYVLWQGRDDLLPLVPYYYLFLSNFLVNDIPLLTVTWSLSVEEQYYLIWPLMLILLSAWDRMRPVILLLLICLCVAAATGALDWLDLRPPQNEHAVFRLPVTSYAAILIGSLLAMLLHVEKGFVAIHAVLGWRWSPVIAFAALAAALVLLPVNLLGWPFLLVHLLMATCLATLVVREDHVARPALSWRPVARVGTISYGLYLYHLIGLHVTNVLVDRMELGETLAVWVVTLSYPFVSIVIAEVSFRTLERFFLSLRVRKPANPDHPLKA